MTVIKNLSAFDLAAITDIHMNAFPNRALSTLGKEAVYRYYDWLFDVIHEADRIGCFLDDELIGFCFSGKFKGALNGLLRKNRGYLIIKIFTNPWLLFSDFFRERILLAARSLGWVKQKVEPQNFASAQPSYGILSIAVAQKYQCDGYGFKLLSEAEQFATGKGYKRMNLSVDHGNQQAISFYECNGWVKIEMNGVWIGSKEKILADG